MLKRLNVRTKLLVVVAPLIALVVAATYAAVIPRQDEAERSSQDRDLVSLLSLQSQLHSGLETESILAVSGASGSTAAMTTIPEVRATNDQLTAAFRSAVSANLGISPDLDAALTSQLERLDGLVDAREAVDMGNAAPGMMVARFDLLLEGFTDIAGFGASAVNAQDVRSLVDLTELLDRSTFSLGTIGRRGAATIAGVTTSMDADRILLQGLQTDREREGESFLTSAPPEYDAGYTEAQSSTTSEYEQLLNTLFLGDPVAVDTISVDQWTTAVSAVLNAEAALSSTAFNQAGSLASAAASDAENEVRNFAAIAVLGLLVALAGTVLVARAITRPLRRLRDAADTLATDQLPALVERLRNPEAGSFELAESFSLAVESKDELGQLAGSINAIQDVAVEVANSQADLLRKGISDMFVNLARRNQTLLDRQIEFIDQLESSEEDPELLENLFKLDHLATRMRRNAESLLVLAGAEPPRRRGGVVPVMDVIRVAIGEVEDFARITLLAIDDIDVNGPAAPDLAHLLSELMENATQFSPPTTSVEVIGSHEADGTYIITITDTGIGMTDDQVVSANTLLAEPPVVGLSLARSLGFIVVGRLAERFGIDVRLVSGRDQGVTACVRLPRTLTGGATSILDDASRGVAPPAALNPSPASALTPRPATAPAEWLADAQAVPAPAAAVSYEPAPTSSDPFESDLDWLVNDSGREVRPIGSAPVPLHESPWASEPSPEPQPPEPAWSAQPAEPAGSAQPAEPAWSAQPAEPAWSAQPPEPAWSAQPPEPAWSAQPVESEPLWSAQPPEPAWSAQPVESEPLWSAQPVEPAWSAQSVEPAWSAAPAPSWATDPIPTAPAASTLPPPVGQPPAPVGWSEPPAPTRDWSASAPMAAPAPVLLPEPAPVARRTPQIPERPARLADLAALGPALAPTASGPAPTQPEPVRAPSAFTSPWGDQSDDPTTAAANAVTRSGLAKRVPGRTLDGDDSDRPTVAATKRSPDDVRRMLSRYRSGLNHGRDEPGGGR